MIKIFSFVFLLILVSCGGGSSQSENIQSDESINTVFPSHPRAWDIVSPESVGMNSQLLNQAFDYAFSDGSFTQAAVVIKDGFLVYERYGGISDNEASILASNTSSNSNLYKSIYGSRDKDSLVTSWSTAKSFVSFLIGIAEEEGYINSVRDSASIYISEWSSDNRNTITIKDL